MSVPGPSPRRPRILVLIIGIAVVAVLAVSGTVLAIVHPWTGKPGAGASPDATPTRAAYPDLLKPAETIMIGERRWVSPCRVLPFEDAARIFGEFPDFSTTDEEYFDHSIPEPYLPPESSCDRGVPGDDPTVALSTTIYDAEAVTASVAGDLAIYQEELEPRIDAVADAKPSTKAGRALKKRIAASLATWKRADAYKGTLEDLDGIVLPDSGTGATKQIGQGIRGVVGYVGFQITWLGSASDAASAGERLDRMAEAYAVVAKNLADDELTQSPEPTVLGTTAKVGPTRVQEPCALFSAALFQSVLGLASNDQSRRSGTQWDLAAQRVSSKTGEERPPANECERDYTADYLPGAADGEPRYSGPQEAALDQGYATARLELNYLRSDAAAEKTWTYILGQAGEGAQIPTTADAAVMKRDGTFDYCYFRIGRYIGSFSVDLEATDGSLSGDIVEQTVPASVYPALISGVADAYHATAGE